MYESEKNVQINYMYQSNIRIMDRIMQYIIALEENNTIKFAKNPFKSIFQLVMELKEMIKQVKPSQIQCSKH